jgi:acetyl-CoA carboxylase biotin carboxyl carrier protein
LSKENSLFPLTDDEVVQILKIIDESNFDEVHLETRGLKLTVGRGSRPVSQEPAPGRIQTTPGSEAKTSAPPKEQTPAAPGTDVPRVSADPAPVEQDGLISIKAPTLGIFYRSPKPGAAPFVEVGSFVQETDTVCLLEVMKLFNAVKAGIRGRVVKICAENTQMVEYNQTLFLVNPEETPEPAAP